MWAPTLRYGLVRPLQKRSTRAESGARSTFKGATFNTGMRTVLDMKDIPVTESAMILVGICFLNNYSLINPVTINKEVNTNQPTIVNGAIRKMPPGIIHNINQPIIKNAVLLPYYTSIYVFHNRQFTVNNVGNFSQNHPLPYSQSMLDNPKKIIEMAIEFILTRASSRLVHCTCVLVSFFLVFHCSSHWEYFEIILKENIKCNFKRYYYLEVIAQQHKSFTKLCVGGSEISIFYCFIFFYSEPNIYT